MLRSFTPGTGGRSFGLIWAQAEAVECASVPSTCTSTVHEQRGPHIQGTMDPALQGLGRSLWPDSTCVCLKRHVSSQRCTVGGIIDDK